MAALKGRPFSAGLQHSGFTGRLTLEMICGKRLVTVHHSTRTHARTADKCSNMGRPHLQAGVKGCPKAGSELAGVKQGGAVEEHCLQEQYLLWGRSDRLGHVAACWGVQVLCIAVDDDDARAGHCLQRCRPVVVRVVPAAVVKTWLWSQD